MRQKVIGQNLSGRDFSNRDIEGYYRNCNFSNCDFSRSTIEAVAVNCDFTNANFSYARLKRFYTPNSTFTNCTFKKPALHTAAHKLVGRWNILQNHEVVAEIVRQWIVANIPQGQYRNKAITYLINLKNRTDLSWPEFVRMEDDTIIVMAFFAFENFPELYKKLREFRPELEPEQLRDEMRVEIG